MDILDQGPIHFETLSSWPRVFRITEALVLQAKARNNVAVSTTVGEDLSDLSWMATSTVLITHNAVLRHPQFPLGALARRAPNLRWIHVTGAGVEPLLPFDWLPSGVALTNNSGVHAEKIRESSLMMLLMLNARVPTIVCNQRISYWEQIFTPTIVGKTALIVGVGDMGGSAAEAARQLGLHTIGIRRSGAPHSAVDRMFAFDALDQLLPEADFVLLATPLTHETKLLLNSRRIALMKAGAGLINIGRAGLVDYNALVEALRAGRISGAILDVYDPEPLPAESPLWSAENIVLMPHVTSDDEDNYLPKSLDLVFENFRRLLSGQQLFNLVDRERGY
jgi:glyoxylate/hydroxypyruvate reductase